jgi:NAD(P)-dependent dehydrogenase (short-subunit alcohol dehydrogenase family)
MSTEPAPSPAAAFDPRQAPLAPDELAGRVIAITGPTSGIGRAVAAECARRGAEVLLIGRNVRRLEALYDEILSLRRHDGAAVVAPAIAPLDLEKALAGDYDAIAEAAQQRWGRIDALLHNAGVLGTLTPIEQYDVPTWVRVMHVNLTAAFALTQVLLPLLRAAADGSLLFTSSSVGRVGRAYWGAYAVSKFGIEGLAEVLAQELEIARVRVNTINPGPARTAMRRQAYPSEDPSTPVAPDALTAAYIALLGPASRGITGRRFDAQ